VYLQSGFKCLRRVNRLLRIKIKFDRVINSGQCDGRDEVVVHRRQGVQSVVHRLQLAPHVSDRGPQTA
jgi:hypothetical protein